MNSIYFIYDSYCPNRASTNRALGYLRALSTRGISVNVIYLMPDKHFNKLNHSLAGITVEYCWDKHYHKGHIGRAFSFFYYVMSLYHRLQPGDIVYLYGEVDLLMVLAHKKGIRLFHERTEHPLVYPPKGRFFKLSINRYIKYCKGVDGLIVISTCLRDYFVEKGVPIERVHIINAFVDPSRFEGLKKQQCEPFFAYCGNGNNKKDKVDALIRVFARVASRHDEIKFYIIGPTKQVFKDEQDNVELVRELGLESRVVFTGMKPASEVPQLLVNAKALFITRPDTLQNRAGFSTKLVEYLASGNPVVTAAVGDIPLFLKNGENAFVYSPENLSAVEDAMEFILSNPEEVHRIGEAGRKVAERHFNAMIEAEKLVSVFKN